VVRIGSMAHAQKKTYSNDGKKADHVLNQKRACKLYRRSRILRDTRQEIARAQRSSLT
jgi:hypothetical protein